MRNLQAWLAVIAALVIVGVIRGATPEETTIEHLVPAEAEGSTQLGDDFFTVMSLTYATKVRGSFDYNEVYESSDVLVVAHVKVTQHGTYDSVLAEVRSSDDLRYEPIEPPGIYASAAYYSALTTEMTYVFELPKDKVPGANFILGLAPTSGLAPVLPAIKYPVPELEISDDLVIIPDSVQRVADE